MVIQLMKNTISELTEIINLFTSRFEELDEASFSEKISREKWSRKEVLGHLVDSAHNNYRRFLCGQYEVPPVRIVYDQEFWVVANDYQHMETREIIALWKMMNQQIVRVLQNMPEQHFVSLANTGKHEPELHTLQFLAEDYVKHLKHHLNQIFPKSYDLVYP